MNEESWESALSRFRTFGANPSVARYLDLFHSDGTVLHPGMTAPLRGSEISDFIERALALMPDFRLEAIRWVARGDTIFVEARNTGSLNSRRITWPSTYRLITRDGRVTSGRAFYDRAAVLSHSAPALAARRDEPHTMILEEPAALRETTNGGHVDDLRIHRQFLQPYTGNWQSPRADRFADFYHPSGTMVKPNISSKLKRSEIAAYYRDLLSDVTDLQLTLQRWAYRPGLLFAEWNATGSIEQRPFQCVGIVDRFLMAGIHIRESVSYFDSLSVPTSANSGLFPGTIFAAGREA